VIARFTASVPGASGVALAPRGTECPLDAQWRRDERNSFDSGHGRDPTYRRVTEGDGAYATFGLPLDVLRTTLHYVPVASSLIRPQTEFAG